MNKLLPSTKVYVSDSKIPQGGRGVFAKIAIKKGELIERCPVIELSPFDEPGVNETSLVTYIYYLGKNKDRLFLALGFGSIYNHSSEANAEYQERYEEQEIDFVALEDIEKDEEILVNYNPSGSEENNPLWFNASRH